ncbi:hypothetical protein SALBM217S_03862 [Streptomyces griseoloalbus]
MQWTSSVSSRSASVRLRAVRMRIGRPAWSSRSGTIGVPPGSFSISSSVSCAGVVAAVAVVAVADGAAASGAAVRFSGDSCADSFGAATGP